jgi:hypothetical protein
MITINMDMRLLEFEEKLTPAAISAMIQKDCQPFLSAIGNEPIRNMLYRGMTGPRVPIQKKQVHLSSRKPMTTNNEIHGLINDYFTRQFGEPFRNALFASGDRGHALGYGNKVLSIFPIGEFTFVWSPEMSDMYDVTWPRPGGFSNVTPSQEMVDVTLEAYDYTNKSFKSALRSGHEIMIRCNNYYAVQPAVVAEWKDMQ